MLRVGSRGLVAAVVLAVMLLVVGAASADVLGVDVPRGTRADPDVAGRLVSGKGYRDTIEHLARWLDRKGVPHRRIGPYRARGTDVTRLLSDDSTTGWLAIHVWRRAGTTWITVVPRPT